MIVEMKVYHHDQDILYIICIIVVIHAKKLILYNRGVGKEIHI